MAPPSEPCPPPFREIAAAVGTPVFVYDAAALRRRIEAVEALTREEGVRVRYAMKACSAPLVLREVLRHGLWIDAVSGNEVLRAERAGFPMGADPPVVMLTADVFRDNAVEVALSRRVLANLGSGGQVDELAAAGYRGAIGLRVNPGFGHGHVSACDTGGPSSKHGIWLDELAAAAERARGAGLRPVLLHAHVGSGPSLEEFERNAARLLEVFAGLLPHLPECEAVNFGGGIPHRYDDPGWQPDLGGLSRTLERARRELSALAGRPVRVEIEPGRFLVAPAGTLVTRVRDVKRTRDNEKGRGLRFALVDAGFCDLVRPAMYGSYHRIEVLSDDPGPVEPLAVAGPLCESGDLFTRDADELVEPRPLPLPRPGDLLLVRDAGAYGAAMSSNYNSVGRAPQVWWDDGRAVLMSRRETIDDLVRTECEEPIEL